MLLIPNFTARSRDSSTLTLAILARPATAGATWVSRIGVSIWQGPHHGAQKSTRVTPSAIEASKFAVLRLIRFADIFFSYRAGATACPYTIYAPAAGLMMLTSQGFPNFAA